MKCDDFFGFDHEMLSVNACSVFFEKLVSEVMAIVWINKTSKNHKNLTLLLKFEHF